MSIEGFGTKIGSLSSPSPNQAASTQEMGIALQVLSDNIAAVASNAPARYINTSTGNDSNDGLTLATPWQSFTNVEKLKNGTITLSGAANLGAVTFTGQEITIVGQGWTGQFTGNITLDQSSLRVGGDSFTVRGLLIQNGSFAELETPFVVGAGGVVATDSSRILVSSNLQFVAATNAYLDCRNASEITVLGLISQTSGSVVSKAICTKYSQIRLSSTIANGISASSFSLVCTGGSTIERIDSPSSIAGLLSAEHPSISVDPSSRLIGWLDRPYNLTQGIFVTRASNASGIVYEDKFVILTWNAADQQLQYNLKTLGNWGVPCICQQFVLGSVATTNGLATVRSTSGRPALVLNTARHFTRSGLIDSSFNFVPGASLCTYNLFDTGGAAPTYTIEALGPGAVGQSIDFNIKVSGLR